MKIRGVYIEDTFAEAFTMRVAPTHHHRTQCPVGARGDAQTDGIRDLGDRLQVRSGYRA